MQQLSQLTAVANGAPGLAENITVSHEIEERAVATLIEEDEEEDDEEDRSEMGEKPAEKEAVVDQGAFDSEPVAQSSSLPPPQAAVSLFWLFIRLVVLPEKSLQSGE